MSITVVQDKLAQVKATLRELGSVLIAYSGGVDSTFLVAVAHEVLGNKAVAVTATSPTYPIRELKQAQDLAKRLDLRHIIIETNELDDPSFSLNNPDRCYYCKRSLFTRLNRIAADEGLAWVLDGANYDDLADYRPGRKAAAEWGVHSPLCEADLTKGEIRILSRQQGLPNWNKPSLSCLASRFPYGTAITPELLGRVSQAEEILWNLGVRQLRVRHYGETARIEVDPEDMGLLVGQSLRREIVEQLRKLGYTYITLDLAGYRTGSMNETI